MNYAGEKIRQTGTRPYTIHQLLLHNGDHIACSRKIVNEITFWGSYESRKTSGYCQEIVISAKM